ncbi:hypothetical protein ACIG0D_27510 [Streptomyces sp. NPDC052773]
MSLVWLIPAALAPGAAMAARSLWRERRRAAALPPTSRKENPQP